MPRTNIPREQLPLRRRLKHRVTWDHIQQKVSRSNLFKREQTHYPSLTPDQAEKWWVELAKSDFMKPPFPAFTVRRGKMRQFVSPEYEKMSNERYMEAFRSTISRLNERYHIFQTAARKMLQYPQKPLRKMRGRKETIEWYLNSFAINQQMMNVCKARGELLVNILHYFIEIETKGMGRQRAIKRLSVAIQINNQELRAAERGIEKAQEAMEQVIERTRQFALDTKALATAVAAFDREAKNLALEEARGDVKKETRARVRQARINVLEHYLTLVTDQIKMFKQYGTTHSKQTLPELKAEAQAIRTQLKNLK